MRYYAWDDVHLQNDLAPEFAFTRAYQLMSGKGLAAREAACLAVSLPAAALPIEEGDWFVGRRVYRPLGISPSYWNDETDGLDHVSYYADLDRLTRVMNRADQTPEQKSAIAELIDFWSDEHVNAKVRKKFDPQMRRELPTDYWTQESAVVFGLYRLAGAQLNYDLLVQKGLPGMRQMLEERLTDETLDENQKDFLQGLLSMLDTLRKLLHRYEAEVESMLSDADDAQAPRLRAVLRCVKNLQNAAPSSFMEAIQIVWLYASFSGTLDFGRLDVALGDWYCHDLDEGVIDQDQALTLLLSFYRLMHQIISRDTRMILGGKGRRNPEHADRFAIMAMKASGIHRQVQPQVSLRMYRGMSPAVRKAGMELLESGLSYPLLYNDEASMQAVVRSMKVTEENAVNYAFFGCGEYVLDHQSMGTPNDIINLAKVLEVTLHAGVDPVTGKGIGLNLGSPKDFATFDELFAAYKRQAEYFTEIAARHHRLVYDTIRENGSMLMMSLLMDDCIQRARAAIDGGIRYLAGTYETYGNITTSDSLAAIRKLVYEEKRMTLAQLVSILDADFEGHEEERQLMLSAPKFGNDDPAADELAQEINTHIFDFTAAQAEKNGLSSYLVVMINNDANVVLGRKTLATADGRRAWTYLSNGNGPMAGMDKQGLTAMLRSMATTRMSHTAGTAQNIKLSRDIFIHHPQALDDLIDGAFDLGILSLNVSVMNRGDMEDAMVHPEKYQNLFVRVGGFSARFIQLDPGTQQDMLHRTLY